ncbi:MAG: sucrase ferredoxin [Chloroflexota bacterium]
MARDKVYCNIAAQALGLDPIGYAGSFDDAVLIEVPLPWTREIYGEVGALPQEAIDLMKLWRKRYEETGVFGHRPLLIAPDGEYSQPGYRRVIYYERPKGPFSHFAKKEYLIPEDDLGLLLWALFEAKESLPEFSEYCTFDHDDCREILVCTHGTIDVACAKFGYPLYRNLRDTAANEKQRVWRVSHFGGHVFAPTLMDMPTGHYWAYVGEAQAKQIVERNGDVTDLRGHYRGWAGLNSGFIQAAERELWQREGWAWFEQPKVGQIIAEDNTDGPQWAEVRITHTLPNDQPIIYQARVEVDKTIDTKPSSTQDRTYAYPQYTVCHLTLVSDK